jgi:cell division protein FtsZ
MSNRYLMGAKMLNGSGSGGDPKVGKAAVEDNPTDIKEILKLDKGTDLLFIVAGLGKGTGSGASPEIAKIAKELNILTIGIVNFPSVNAEGRQIYENADASFNLLKDQVTSITRISNDKIIQNNKADISFIEAFHKANEDVANTINDIVQMINSASDMNLDFADIRRFFESHKTFMSGNFSLNIEDEYTPEKLKKVIHDSIKASYEEVNINTDDVKILINFKFGKKTPACFINDVRHVFKEETGDNGLSLVHGVEYVDNNIVEASYLMSANDDNVPIKEQEVTTIHKDDEFSIFEEDNISFNKNDTSIIRDENNDTSFGIKQEHIKYDTEELISDHETM